MKKLPILVAMVMIIFLSACSNDLPSLHDRMHDQSSTVNQQSTKDSNVVEFYSQPSIDLPEQEIVATEEDAARKAMCPSKGALQGTEPIESTSPTEEVKLGEEEIAIPDSSVPALSEAPTEPQPMIDSENGSKSESIEGTEPIPECKPHEEIKSFDVFTYIEYAKNYASKQGLALDSSAVSCWDDPISANADSKYLERDIRDRLDWYCASGYMAVWIWSADEGNDQYSIYIGYA